MPFLPTRESSLTNSRIHSHELVRVGSNKHIKGSFTIVLCTCGTRTMRIVHLVRTLAG